MIGATVRTDDFRSAMERKNRAIGTQRIGALNKLYADRYRGTREDYVLPDDDAGLEDLKILLHHYALNNPMAIPRIIKLRAPWMGHNRAISVTEEVFAFPRRWRADTLGRLLHFTGEEWRRLRVRIIEPIDMTKQERRAFSQELYLQRRQLRRRKEGKKPRPQWEADHNIGKTKPWEALGMSRPTWYRKGKPAVQSDRETGVVAIKLSIGRPDLSHRAEATESLRKGVREQGRRKPDAARLLASLSKPQVLDASADAHACTSLPVPNALFLDRAESEWLAGWRS
jgi:hypothetical protein